MNRIEKIKFAFKIFCVIVFLFTCYVLKLQGFTLATNTIADEDLYEDSIVENVSNTAIVQNVAKDTEKTVIENSVDNTIESVALVDDEVKSDELETKSESTNELIEDTTSTISNTTVDNVITNSVNDSVVDTVSNDFDNTTTNTVVNNIVEAIAQNDNSTNTVTNTEIKNTVDNNEQNSIETENVVSDESVVAVVEESVSEEESNNQQEVIKEQEKVEQKVSKEQTTKVTTNKEQEIVAKSDGKIHRIQESLKYLNDISFENKDMKVTVTAIKDDAIPNGSTLEVKEIKSNDDKYKELEQNLIDKVEEDEKYLAGFLAYDITLKNPAGEIIEPNGKVNVAFDFKKNVTPNENINSEDLEISVHHFEEDKQGKIKNVVDLTKNNDVKNIDIKEEIKVSKVEFETETFSPFTITYRWRRYSNYNYTNYVKVNVHFVDENGNELTSIQQDVNQTFTDGTGNNSYTIADIALSSYINRLTGTDATNYRFIDAHYAEYNGKIITSIKAYRRKDTDHSIDPNTVNCTVEFYNGNEIVGIIEYESGDPREIDVYLVYADNTGISISDTIANDGCINALTGGTIIPASQNVIYKWYRSTDGRTYNPVRRIKVTGELYNITTENGPSLNVALDEGANKYYKVEKYIINTSGEEEKIGEETYKVPYHNEIQNGSFESPVIPNRQDASNNIYKSNWQMPNGTEGLIWKTTGTYGGRDVEIVNVVNDVTETLRNYNFAYVPDGNQCAELNCEKVGALYQDILTVPGSQLYWSLYHRARGPYAGDDYTYIGSEQRFTDTMYVIAMSTEMAEKYDVTTNEKVRAVLTKVQNHEPGFEDIDIITIKTTNNGTGTMTFANGTTLSNIAGTSYGSSGTFSKGNTTYSYSSSAWHYYTGHFSIPTNQYLTRYFFVAGSNTENASGSNTMGNLLDDIVVSSELPPPNDGQATIRLTKNVVGLDELPTGYSVPFSATYNIYNNSSNHSTGVSETTRTRNYNSYSLVYDENDVFTGIRRQVHDYTLTLPPNGDAELIKFKEAGEASSANLGLDYNYIVPGLDLVTTYTVYKTVSGTNNKVQQLTGTVTNYDTDIGANVLINSGDTIEIEFTNTYIKQTQDFSFTKQGEDPTGHSNLRLPGANFKLTKVVSNIEDPVITYNATSNSQGIVQFNDVRYGTYILEEVGNVAGYKPLEKTYTVVVTNSSVTIDGTLIDEPTDFIVLNELAKVTINKVDEGHNLLTKSVFNLKDNATMNITRIDDLEHDTYIHDNTPDGILDFTNIRYSDDVNKYVYTLTETQAPSGYYKFNKEIKFYVTYDATNKKNVIHLDNLDEIHEYVELSDDLSTIIVVNTQRDSLPVAGSVGTNRFYVIGTLIIGLTFLKINIIKKGKKEND